MGLSGLFGIPSRQHPGLKIPNVPGSRRFRLDCQAERSCCLGLSCPLCCVCTQMHTHVCAHASPFSRQPQPAAEPVQTRFADCTVASKRRPAKAIHAISSLNTWRQNCISGQPMCCAAAPCSGRAAGTAAGHGGGCCRPSPLFPWDVGGGANPLGLGAGPGCCPRAPSLCSGS